MFFETLILHFWTRGSQECLVRVPEGCWSTALQVQRAEHQASPSLCHLSFRNRGAPFGRQAGVPYGKSISEQTTLPTSSAQLGKLARHFFCFGTFRAQSSYADHTLNLLLSYLPHCVCATWIAHSVDWNDECCLEGTSSENLLCSYLGASNC